MRLDLKEYDVSVILTLFNSKVLFRRALNSVLGQMFKDFELIIVDDGSTDGIEEEIFPLLKSNGNFKYIRHSNRKHPLSLNTGICSSSGKFITFLDSDDEYLPGHLMQRISFFRDNPETDLIHSPALLIGDEVDFYVPDANDNSKNIHLKDCIIGGTLFGKRNVFEELEGFRDIYSHDFDFYNRADQSGKYVITKFDSLTYKYYRNNYESVISKMKREQYDN
jgi:glycosyltransferase involved in cell wall biosynthesis